MNFANFLRAPSSHAHDSEIRAEAVACLRESLALCEHTNNVRLKQKVLMNLINMASVQGGNQFVPPAEAEELRSRPNHLSVKTGREPDTRCVICQDLLVKDAAGDGGLGEAGSNTGLSAVRVLRCGHQFHPGCLEPRDLVPNDINAIKPGVPYLQEVIYSLVC